MILFLNGPFGVGKTSVAKVLVEKIPNAMLYDPEILGTILKRALGPVKKVNDYQDYALWRRLVVEVARLLRKVSVRPLVIPMTVWRRAYFDSMIDRLHRIDPDLACFQLSASKDVLMRRILSNSQDKGAYAWRMSHVEACIATFRDPAFGVESRTDNRTPAEAADVILETLKGVNADTLQSKV